MSLSDSDSDSVLLTSFRCLSKTPTDKPVQTASDLSFSVTCFILKGSTTLGFSALLLPVSVFPPF